MNERPYLIWWTQYAVSIHKQRRWHSNHGIWSERDVIRSWTLEYLEWWMIALWIKLKIIMIILCTKKRKLLCQQWPLTWQWWVFLIFFFIHKPYYSPSNYLYYGQKMGKLFFLLPSLISTHYLCSINMLINLLNSNESTVSNDHEKNRCILMRLHENSKFQHSNKLCSSPRSRNNKDWESKQ